MIQLRPYQTEAVQAVYRYLRSNDDNPCVVIPTAGGKNAIAATICKDAVQKWCGRVLLLAHVKELLEQTASTLRRTAPDLKVGIYSAGLARRDISQPVIVAGIQSVYKRASQLGRFDLVIVDEVHRIPTAEGDGQYQTFLADAKLINQNVRLIGLTATPYRLKSGLICGPDNLLNSVCYEVGVKELIRSGYLCPLTTKSGRRQADCSQLHVRGGEYVTSEVEELMDSENLVSAACREIIERTCDRHSVLIFAASVAHANHVCQKLQEMTDEPCGLIAGNTPAHERETLIARFRGEQIVADLFGTKLPPLKYLINVNVLTTGFDAPNVDCVVLLRPTMSPGLLVQMCGRGFRLHPDKADCLILDFAGNIKRIGPIDAIKITERTGKSGEGPAKDCPECRSVIAVGYSKCPDCGYVFPPPEKQQHESTASDAGVLSGQVTTTTYSVADVYYSVHTKRGASDDAPKSMRVEYRVALNDYKAEWICFEHQGFVRQKAIKWWRRRSPDPVPETAQRAVDIANADGLAMTTSITVRSVAGEEFDRIVDYELGSMPEPVAAEIPLGDLDEIPF